jgi:Cys-tRNA(Pro)/Cys-tRNA(Cys) deacylase
MTKTNAIRILEQAGVQFSITEYAVDESSLDAVSVAGLLGVEPERVFKTLVTVSDSGDHAVFCIPGNATLDLKKAAAACAAGRLAMLPLRELKPLTGYIHGACSPFGMKKALPTFVDESVELFETVFVSAGLRGMQIRIAPGDLLALTEATPADLTRV